MRVEKRKRASLYGLQLEANRTAADHDQGRDFAASDIQWELTPFNFFLVKAENWNKAVTAALKEAEIQERKNSVVLLDGFYGASKEWFLNKSMAEIVDYFEDCLAFHEKHYGKVINAVIHFDEAIPHLTCQSLPIVQREDGHCSLVFLFRLLFAPWSSWLGFGANLPTIREVGVLIPREINK